MAENSDDNKQVKIYHKHEKQEDAHVEHVEVEEVKIENDDQQEFRADFLKSHSRIGHFIKLHKFSV